MVLPRSGAAVLTKECIHARGQNRVVCFNLMTPDLRYPSWIDADKDRGTKRNRNTSKFTPIYLHQMSKKAPHRTINTLAAQPLVLVAPADLWIPRSSSCVLNVRFCLIDAL